MLADIIRQVSAFFTAMCSISVEMQTIRPRTVHLKHW